MSHVVIGFSAVLAAMILIPMLLAWSGRRRKLRIGRTGGKLVLRMPRGHHAILSAVAILPFAGFTAVALAVTWDPATGSERFVLAGFTAVIGALLGGYLLALEARGCIRLDEAGFEKVGAVRSSRHAWSEVAGLAFNPRNEWFVLTLAGGKRIWVVEGLDGIVDFAELALERLPPRVLDESPDAARALREVARS